MRTIEHVLPIKRHQIDRVLRYLLDTLLACVGSLLVPAVIVLFQLDPAIPIISIVYLLVVLALAITRGRYAAILSAVAAFLFLSYFIVPPLYTFATILTQEWIALFILLIVAILTGHLAAALRERKQQVNCQTEQDAQTRANELTAIFEAITDGVAVCDARGDVRYTNPAYRALLELEEDADPSLLQLNHRFTWLAARDLEGRPLTKEQLAMPRVLRGERLSGTHAMDFLCRTRKGKDLTVNISGAPIRDAAGQIAGGVVVSRDVTRQYRLEQQLQYSERKLRSLVESNILGVVVADVDGRIYEINDRVAHMVGYSKDELLSETFNWQHLVPPDSYEAQAQMTKTLLSTGVVPPQEGEYLRKDGSRFPVLTAATLLDQKRRLGLGVILDITDRKAAEQRKQEFLNMVSHELRTPLTSIMGLIELALMQIELRPRELSPEAEGLLVRIEKVLKRAVGQVRIVS